jgi:hypothetical protein
VFHIVDEGVVELSFEYLPGVAAWREFIIRIRLDLIKPIISFLYPSLDLGSFHQGQEQTTSFEGVLCDFSAPVHENIPSELHQKVLSLSPVPFITLRQYAFESDVLVLPVACCGNAFVEGGWIGIRRSW